MTVIINNNILEIIWTRTEKCKTTDTYKFIKWIKLQYLIASRLVFLVFMQHIFSPCMLFRSGLTNAGNQWDFLRDPLSTMTTWTKNKQ